MRVTIPSPLLSYTKQREVSAAGTTLDEVTRDLDRQFPGLRFRMVDEQDQLRSHMRAFLDADEIRDMGSSLDTERTLHFVQALSGG
jgi:sulfur-carrier protein